MKMEIFDVRSTSSKVRLGLIALWAIYALSQWVVMNDPAWYAEMDIDRRRIVYDFVMWSLLGGWMSHFDVPTWTYFIGLIPLLSTYWLLTSGVIPRKWRTGSAAERGTLAFFLVWTFIFIISQRSYLEYLDTPNLPAFDMMAPLIARLGEWLWPPGALALACYLITSHKTPLGSILKNWWRTLYARQRLASAGLLAWTVLFWSGRLARDETARYTLEAFSNDLSSWVWPVGVLCIVLYMIPSRPSA